MGSYSELRLGAFHLGWIKDEIDPLVMTLFRETDKRVYTAEESDLDLLPDLAVEMFREGQAPVIVRYSCPVPIVKDRLELMGFTREVAEAGFRLGLNADIERYEGFPSRGDVFEGVLGVLRGLNLDEWLTAMDQIREQVLTRENLAAYASDDSKPLLEYMLSWDWYGFPGREYLHFVRLALDASDEADELVYDLTDLHLSEWIDGERNLTQFADEMIAEVMAPWRRVIVLTEGKTDKQILERSMQVLYPHLVDYFRFMGFEGARIEGGAGALANTVKAFAGAGVINRILALFDNDTAAQAAMKVLKTITLPDNIVVLQYPTLEIAKCYPTLGPSGRVEMDVNGLAGSLELYFGIDVLCADDGELMPIHWRGYDSGLHKYQGQLLRKAELQKRFEQKLAACEEDPSQIDHYDWSGIRAILDGMRSAFHEQNASEILEGTGLH